MKIILSKDEIASALKDYVKKIYALEADSVSVIKSSKIIKRDMITSQLKTEISAIVKIK
jgi:hypothetical protein